MDARGLWALGDYPAIAERLQPAAEALVEAAGVQDGHRVLDVAAGTGNTAAAALGRGARVVASDFAPTMVELGRRRLPGIEWVEADAQDLPFEDGGFDRVLSTFGAMFAPDPARTAAELLRVTKPGGVVGMTTWAAGSILDAAARILREALQAASAEDPATRWQDHDDIRGHFGGARVTVETRTLTWRFESPEAWLSFISGKAPPIVAARAAIGEDRWPDVAARILAAVADTHITPDGGFLEETPYLLIVATREA